MEKLGVASPVESVPAKVLETQERRKPENRLSLFLKAFGPGFITGAADDDPSGIGTYTIVGAQFGSTFLWTALLTWPMMAAVQMACARIGMVTGQGLACSLEKKVPRWVAIVFCLALFVANTLNVGADLAAMADAAEAVGGGSSHVYVLVFGLTIAWATIRLRYSVIARVLKWLALTIFSYVAVAFIVGPDWRQALIETFSPRFPTGHEQWAALVAILGTTITPYLFFWQASQEVEEEKAKGRTSLAQRIGATPAELFARKFDVGSGTFFSNIVMFFIILSSGLTLHGHGITHIGSSSQAAQALRPIAGRFASLLYATGLLGVGLLAVPTLTGSAAYALAETFQWAQGLDAKWKKARSFYTVVLSSTLIAVALDFSNFNPILALYWSAIVNGLLAPFLLFVILMIIRDKTLMKGQPSSILAQVTVAVTVLMMVGAAVGMFL